MEQEIKMLKRNNKILMVILIIFILLCIGLGVYYVFLDNNNNTGNVTENNNTKCNCDNSKEKVNSSINALAKKYNLKKLERYYAKINYCYEKREEKCNLRYYVPLVIEDGNLVLCDDVIIEPFDDLSGQYDNEHYYSGELKDIFPGTPKKLLFINKYLYGAATVLYIIDSNGDLYTLDTNTRGIESSYISKKPNELTFSKLNMENNKFIDFYYKDDKYYISTTEGKIFELDNIYDVKLGKELN